MGEEKKKKKVTMSCQSNLQSLLAANTNNVQQMRLNQNSGTIKNYSTLDISTSLGLCFYYTAQQLVSHSDKGPSTLDKKFKNNLLKSFKFQLH